MTPNATYYDSAGRPVRQVAPGGRTTLTEYNAKGEVEYSVIDMNGNGVKDPAGPDRVTKYENTVENDPNHGNVRKSTSYIFPNDNATPVVASVSDASVNGMQSWSSSFGRTSHSVTTYTGNGGRTVTTTNPDGSTITQTYLNGKLMSSAYSVLGTTTYTYDGHNRLASEQSTVNGAPRTTSYAYNANGQLTQVTDPAGRVSKYTYDNMGRRTALVPPSGRTVFYNYKPTGELESTYGSDTYPVEYSYDSQGRMSTLKTFKEFPARTGAAQTTWNYDNQRGFLTSKTYADSSGPSYTYNADGSLATRVWAGGITTSYAYDNTGDLASVSYTGTGEPSMGNVSYTRDRIGRPKSVTDGTGTRNMTYNADLSLASESIPYILNHKINYGYDNLGRRTSMALKNGETNLNETTYGYDGMSRLASVSGGGATAAYTRVTGSSLLSTTAITNGASNVMTVSRSYDSLNRLAQINSLTSVGYSYIYNDRDQRTRCTFADGSYWEYSYDNLGQVIGGRKFSAPGVEIPGLSFGYGYDMIGNRTESSAGISAGSSSYTTNNVNQYTSRTVPDKFYITGSASESAKVAILESGAAVPPVVPDRFGKYFSHLYTVDNSASAISKLFKVHASKGNIVALQNLDVFVPKTPEEFTYSPNGNLLADGRFTYAWDGENRLVTATCTSNVKDECAYDYTSRRTSKNVYGWVNDAWQLSKTEKYAWNGWQLVGIFNASNQLVRSYCWGEDGLISDTDVVNSKTYLAVKDGNLNIVGYVDASNGTLVASYEYDAFGRIISKSGIKADDFNFRFGSYFFDSETGLYYLGYRYYNPETGRFISRDPLGEQPDNENPYRITSNDTINKWDYLGLWTKIDRNPEKSRATTCAEKKDTIKGLAKIVKLDDSEYKLWLKLVLADGSLQDLQDAVVVVGSTYSVPNEVHITQGDSSGVLSFGGTVLSRVISKTSEYEKNYKTKNYFVHNHVTSGVVGNSVSEIQGYLQSPDIAVWAHAGHGRDYIIPGKVGDEVGIVLGNPARGYSPYNFPVHHKLEKVHMFSCYMDSQEFRKKTGGTTSWISLGSWYSGGGWWPLISPYGDLDAPTTSISW